MNLEIRSFCGRGGVGTLGAGIDKSPDTAAFEFGPLFLPRIVYGSECRVDPEFHTDFGKDGISIFQAY